jgi:hypothetical protein
MFIYYKIPARCNNNQSLFYFTAISFYMFQMPATTVLCPPDDGCKRHPKHVEGYCSKIK